MQKPTYTASEIKKMAMSMELDHEGAKILVDLIEAEIEFYSDEDYVVLCEASMLLFTRALLKGSMKYLK